MTATRHFSLTLQLKITVVIVGLLLIICVSQPKSKWDSSYTLTDGVEESECSCSKVMRGNVDEIAKAKLLVFRKDFHGKVHVPDEFYIDATLNCKWVVGFLAPFLKLLA